MQSNRRQEERPFAMAGAGAENEIHEKAIGRRTASHHDPVGLSVPHKKSRKFTKQNTFSSGRRNSNSQVKDVVKGRVSWGSNSSCGSKSKSNKAIRKSKNKIRPRKSKD